MAGLGRVGSSLVGASLFHALCFFVESQSYQAAWGWFKSVADEKEFTCVEGEMVGCVSTRVDKDCDTYSCTVKAKNGYTCIAATMKMQCAKTASSGTKFAPNSADSQCISNTTQAEANTMTVDSALTWDTAANCTKTPVDAASTAPGTSLVGTILLVGVSVMHAADQF